jgi:hypothetical protein
MDYVDIENVYNCKVFRPIPENKLKYNKIRFYRNTKTLFYFYSNKNNLCVALLLYKCK